MEDLVRNGFKIRGLVTDNHSANVSAFKILLKGNPGDKKQFIYLPNADFKTYVFFDSVHLIKNIRNNLLRAKKFVFPEFQFEVCGKKISSGPGYISWSDLHKIYDEDQKLDANLRKAPKLSFKALHPGDNKQNVSLALAIFHETTVAACKSYFPHRKDVENFLLLIHTWWTISNSNNRYNSNLLGNAVTESDGKLNFLMDFSEWLEKWGECPNFCLSKQTSNALVLTLKSHAMLVKDLLAEGYEFVMTRRLQSDPIEHRFSQYRQMSGGRFLVSLREVQSSERILACRSLLKIGIDSWNFCNISVDAEKLDEFMEELSTYEIEIMEASLCNDSAEVAQFVAGYMARKVLEKSDCNECSTQLIQSNSIDSSSYLELLSRGGLIQPSEQLSYVASTIFAQIDFINSFIPNTSVRIFCRHALEKYAPRATISCAIHEESNRKSLIKIAVNVYYNNQQKLACNSVRKTSLEKFKSRQRVKE